MEKKGPNKPSSYSPSPNKPTSNYPRSNNPRLNTPIPHSCPLFVSTGSKWQT